MDIDIEFVEERFVIHFDKEHFEKEAERMAPYVDLLDSVSATFPALFRAYTAAILRLVAIVKRLESFNYAAEPSEDMRSTVALFLNERARFVRLHDLTRKEYQYAKDLMGERKPGGGGVPRVMHSINCGQSVNYGAGSGASEIHFRPSTGVT